MSLQALLDDVVDGPDAGASGDKRDRQERDHSDGDAGDRDSPGVPRGTATATRPTKTHGPIQSPESAHAYATAATGNERGDQPADEATHDARHWPPPRHALPAPRRAGTSAVDDCHQHPLGGRAQRSGLVWVTGAARERLGRNDHERDGATVSPELEERLDCAIRATGDDDDLAGPRYRRGRRA